MRDSAARPRLHILIGGEAGPTSEEGHKTKAQPSGFLLERFNPVAVAMHAGFVARSFSGMPEHLAEMIRIAIAHRGFALIDVLQPCVSFNKVNNFAWYKKRVYELPEEYDPKDWNAAVPKAAEWGERIPIGLIYENDRPAFGDRLQVLKGGPLVGRRVDRVELKRILGEYR